MFHANCWGLALPAPMAGATLVMPGAKLDGASIYELLDDERVTITAAVPTVWLMLLHHLEANDLKLPHLKRVVIGGSACPRAMIEKFEENYGVEVCHAWGMTEMSPLGTLCSHQAGLRRSSTGEAMLDVQVKQGHAAVRRRDEDHRRRRQGAAVGRQDLRPAQGARLRGRAHYFKDEGGEILDADGFFDTGDVATIDPYGYMQITDRAKDVIKSGGEWISSIDLENLAVGHPKVAEAAVIGVQHPKWDERPLLVIVLKKDQTGEQGRNPRLHAGQDRQVVDARRRRLRRRDPAHRDRQNPEDGAARAVQGLRAPDGGRGGVKPGACPRRSSIDCSDKSCAGAARAHRRDVDATLRRRAGRTCRPRNATCTFHRRASGRSGGC